MTGDWAAREVEFWLEGARVGRSRRQRVASGLLGAVSTEARLGVGELDRVVDLVAQ